MFADLVSACAARLLTVLPFAVLYFSALYSIRKVSSTCAISVLGETKWKYVFDIAHTYSKEGVDLTITMTMNAVYWHIHIITDVIKAGLTECEIKQAMYTCSHMPWTKHKHNWTQFLYSRQMVPEAQAGGPPCLLAGNMNLFSHEDW